MLSVGVKGYVGNEHTVDVNGDLLPRQRSKPNIKETYIEHFPDKHDIIKFQVHVVHRGLW